MNLKPHQLKTYREVKEQIRPDTWCTAHVNCFRATFNGKESPEHRNKKFERWCYWRRRGFNVVVEAILTNGKRPDLIIFNESEIFIEEIVMSEKEESIIKKKIKYPWEVFVIKVEKE